MLLQSFYEQMEHLLSEDRMSGFIDTLKSEGRKLPNTIVLNYRYKHLEAVTYSAWWGDLTVKINHINSYEDPILTIS